MVKLLRTNKAGIPDLLLIKNGKASFVEVKAEGGTRSPLQRMRAEELERMGCVVKCVGGVKDEVEGKAVVGLGF